MRTEDLVSLLSTGLEPVDPRRAGRRLLAAWLAGMAVSMLLLAAVLRFNAGLAREMAIPMFWARAAYCACLALAGVVAVKRLGHPGTRLGLVPLGLAVPVLAMWLSAAVVLANASASERVPLMLGHSAYACPWLISLLSAPLFIALVWALRGGAPTHLRLTGAATGLAAGAGGALVYTMHCPELAPPFLALWYLLGMLMPAALGGALGTRLLRW